MLKGIEAAGFAWVQVHAPPPVVLGDREAAQRHARCLRTALDTGTLRLVLHGPDALSAGTGEDDRAFDGLLDYAATAGAELVVYHGANFRAGADEGTQRRARERLNAEAAALRQRTRRLEALGLTVCVENLAPVWPGPPRLCHDPQLVRDLVLRAGSPRYRMLFDVGHANIAGEAAGRHPADLLDAVQDQVGLFHVHDNLGIRRGRQTPPGLDPLRLDLHLAPGSGTVPWETVSPLMLEGDAPLVLEVHPPHRPEPLSLAEVTAELLLQRRHAVSAARTAVAAHIAARGVPSVPPG